MVPHTKHFDDLLSRSRTGCIAHPSLLDRSSVASRCALCHTSLLRKGPLERYRLVRFAADPGGFHLYSFVSLPVPSLSHTDNPPCIALIRCVSRAFQRPRKSKTLLRHCPQQRPTDSSERAVSVSALPRCPSHWYLVTFVPECLGRSPST